MIRDRLLDVKGNEVAIGEVFYDRSGNECYYREDGSLSVKTLNKLSSRTIQSERDKVDIHKILEKFGRTGVLSNVRSDSPIYGDFSSVVDYQSAVMLVQNAKARFNELNSDIRKRFGNDPTQLLAFLEDPLNREEAIKLGLIEKPTVSQGAPQDVKDPLGAQSGETTPA